MRNFALRQIFPILAALLVSTATLTHAADNFRVALTTKDFGYLPLFVAARSGIFAEEGLDVQWVQMRSNVTTAALIGGEIDVAASAGSAMRVAARGAPLRAIFFPYYKCTFVLMGAPEIKTVPELRGKVIGNNAPGSTTELAAAVVLESYGLNPKKDVRFFLAGGAETALAAMQQGLIQARPFNPDAAFVLKRKGFNVLAVLADFGPWPWGGYATSLPKLSQERNKIKRWLRGMVRSLLFMANRREETLRIAREEFGYPRDVLEDALNVSLKAIDRANPGGATDDSLKKNVELTIAEPLGLKEPPAISKLVDFSLLYEAQTELGIRKR